MKTLDREDPLPINLFGCGGGSHHLIDLSYGQHPTVKQQVVSGGTGFLFSAKDYIITNWHVVKGAGSILANFANGEQVEAKVVAKDYQKSNQKEGL